MSDRWVGFVVGGKSVVVVDAQIPEDPDAPIFINADDTWPLQNGERSHAYDVLYQRCTGYLRENNIACAVVKGSAVSRNPATKALLSSAEVRGVVIAAASSVCEVKLLDKAVISRTYGDRKVDEYIEDGAFWNEHTTGGRLRKLSREAAMLLIAAKPE